MNFKTSFGGIVFQIILSYDGYTHIIGTYLGKVNTVKFQRLSKICI